MVLGVFPILGLVPPRSVHHRSPTVLLLVDLINHFEFPDAPALLKESLAIVDNIVGLKHRARSANVPVLYVNDNFGQWRSNAKELLRYCVRKEAVGREFVKAIAPDQEDYFVLKPMHSGFYQTPLDALLRYFGAKSIVMAGIATNSCIVCTAHDAKMRDIEITVASDCCAARSQQEHTQALDHLTATTGARVVKAASIRFTKTRKPRGT